MERRQKEEKKVTKRDISKNPEAGRPGATLKTPRAAHGQIKNNNNIVYKSDSKKI
jgi:hypothetical protein